MYEKFKTLISQTTNKYEGKYISAEMLDEISKNVLSAVSDFEREHNVGIVGLTISKRDSGKVAIGWDEIVKGNE